METENAHIPLLMGEYVLFLVLKDFSFRTQAGVLQKRQQSIFFEKTFLLRELPKTGEQAMIVPLEHERSSFFSEQDQNCFIQSTSMRFFRTDWETGNGTRTERGTNCGYRA